jgi:FixJ family two-component response regulator
MSGHTDKGIVRDGVLEPGIDFLAKPFTAESLLAAVDKAMSRGAGGSGPALAAADAVPPASRLPRPRLPF